MEVVAVDIVGPLSESTTGNFYLLVAGDYFTRWVKAYPIPNHKTVTVARKLIQGLFCRFSAPEQIHSDQGQQFESCLIGEIVSYSPHQEELNHAIPPSVWWASSTG